MVNKEKLIGLTYLILFSCAGFIYSTKVIDYVGIQWYYLSYLNLALLGYIIFKRINKQSKVNPPPFFSNPINLLYFIFFIICLASTITSINYSVSIVAISKIVISLTSLFIINELEVFQKVSLKHLAALISFYLLIEVGFSLRGYYSVIEVTDFKFSMAETYLKGIASNKNVTSSSIAFKLPFLYILFYSYKNKFLRFLLILICCIAYFNLILLSSRAIILSVTLCILFYIFGSIISFYRSKENFKIYTKQIGIYLLPIILAISYAYSVIEDQDIKIENRVSTVNIKDVSATTRLRYYEKGINYFLENPIFGCGIGNWQLISIKMDSDKIQSYIVPYVAHNDFIELLTEIGILGALSYLLFVLSPLYFLIKIFFNSSEHKIRNTALILTLPFIIYFVDSNLNFPQYRTIMQVGLIMYLMIVYSFYKKQKIKF